MRATIPHLVTHQATAAEVGQLQCPVASRSGIQSTCLLPANPMVNTRPFHATNLANREHNRKISIARRSSSPRPHSQHLMPARTVAMLGALEYAPDLTAKSCATLDFKASRCRPSPQ